MQEEVCKEPQVKLSQLPLVQCRDRTIEWEPQTRQMRMLIMPLVEVGLDQLAASTSPIVELIKATTEASINRISASIGTLSLQWPTILHRQASEWSIDHRIRRTNSNLKRQEPTRSTSSNLTKRLWPFITSITRESNGRCSTSTSTFPLDSAQSRQMMDAYSLLVVQRILPSQAIMHMSSEMAL